MADATQHVEAGAPAEHGLITRILRRDEQALAELYDRFAGPVFAVALRITGERTAAEEVVQDVFHAVWRTAEGFRPGGSVGAWIIGIARHRAIDATRARGFRAREREQGIERALTLMGGERTDETAEQRLEGERLHNALRQLNPHQREAVGLAFYAGMSHSEIAAHTGTPVGTVKTRLRLGLRHLRRQLAAPA